MSNRFNSYRNNLILTSVFALMAFVGGYHLGSQQNNQDMRPEIRSSQTSIVSVERSATDRLKQQVERDGGTIENARTPSVVTEQAEKNTQKVEDVKSGVEIPELEEKNEQYAEKKVVSKSEVKEKTSAPNGTSTPETKAQPAADVSQEQSGAQANPAQTDKPWYKQAAENVETEFNKYVVNPIGKMFSSEEKASEVKEKTSTLKQTLKKHEPGNNSSKRPFLASKDFGRT